METFEIVKTADELTQILFIQNVEYDSRDV